MSSIDPSWFTGIVDLSHNQDVDVDWVAVRAGGVVAVIHKATEGLDVSDGRFAGRRAGAKAAGLLWGSYHYAGLVGSDGAAQADYFLAKASPEPDELVCFDCEKHGTLANMEAFSARIVERLGRRPLIYGRRLLRNLLADGPVSPVTQGRLWYDEYPGKPHATPQEDLPRGWADWTLWQFTDGTDGCEPRQTPGIGACDRSAFKGTADELRAAWPL